VYPDQVDVLQNCRTPLHTVLGEYDKAETMCQCALQNYSKRTRSMVREHILYQTVREHIL